MPSPGRHLGMAVLVATAVGCSGLKPYPNELPTKNITIRTATNAGSMFASVRVELDVHGVDASCRTQYLGTVPLDQPSGAVGIAPERGSVLTFHFLSSNFLGSSRGRISREVFIAPRPDQRFEIDVTYRDDLYDVVLRERLRNGTLRDVALQDAKACR